MFHCLPDSAWADGNLAEAARLLGKLVEHINQSIQPRSMRTWDALYLSNVIPLAEMWCETNKACLKNPPQPTSALAITTILENWVSQEEEKGREEEVEVAELIEDQKAQGRDSC